jgi:hypothetical protein
MARGAGWTPTEEVGRGGAARGLRVRWVAEEAAVEGPLSSARGLEGERLEAALDDERNPRRRSAAEAASARGEALLLAAVVERWVSREVERRTLEVAAKEVVGANVSRMRRLVAGARWWIEDVANSRITKDVRTSRWIQRLVAPVFFGASYTCARRRRRRREEGWRVGTQPYNIRTDDEEVN